MIVTIIPSIYLFIFLYIYIFPFLYDQQDREHFAILIFNKYLAFEQALP